jgi:hypothetical protein
VGRAAEGQGGRRDRDGPAGQEGAHHRKLLAESDICGVTLAAGRE